MIYLIYMSDKIEPFCGMTVLAHRFSLTGFLNHCEELCTRYHSVPKYNDRLNIGI